MIMASSSYWRYDNTRYDIFLAPLPPPFLFSLEP